MGISGGRGTLGHAGPAQAIAAAALVRTGRVISLNRPLDEPARFGRPSLRRTVREHRSARPLGAGRTGLINDDVVELALQGASHWDALSHFGVVEPGGEGVYHGGAGLDETQQEGRARHLGIDLMQPGLFTRGVLLDLVRSEGGVDAQYLPAGARLGREAVERCLASEGLALRTGDAVLLYTGYRARLAAEGEPVPLADAGIDGSTLSLWAEAKIAALAADNVGVEAIPTDYAVHAGALRTLGLPLGELWLLGELADACRASATFEFLLVSVPLFVPGAFGSPANAVAVL